MSPVVAPFANEPLVDFSHTENISQMQAALAQVKRDFGREYFLIIHGEQIKTGQKMRSTNPAAPREIVGVAQRATVTHAEQALASASTAFGEDPASKGWRWIAPEARAKYAFKAADVMRRRRFELAAWLICEVGKSWSEADADVAEAIDFCEFYGREALRYGERQPLGTVPGEKNSLVYLPLGVGVVIAPWNFPLAILTGMTVAAWVSGNTVVLKPSSESIVIAAKFMEVMEEIGLPPGVVNFITGPGGEIGECLVLDPRTRFVAFTGSREVGVGIVEQAAQQQPGQRWIKRVIAELGGKGAVIVDDECDLDAAAQGIVESAFGFQGQKCSAGSRAIVHAAVYDRVLEKVIALTQALRIGPTIDPQYTMGPVVSEKQLATIMKYIEVGARDAQLVSGGTRVSREGFFLEPAIFSDVDPQSRLAQDEIFGPVLSFLRANTFADALQIANGTDYGLTSAVYSSHRDHLDLACRALHVGNLYLNRKCTGAVVGAHPFGGFNMSGTNSKAGGRDYLQLFLQAKSVAEKITE